MEDLMQNELTALWKLSHPSMIRIYELLHTDDKYYIISELIKEGELKKFADERK